MTNQDILTEKSRGAQCSKGSKNVQKNTITSSNTMLITAKSGKNSSPSKLWSVYQNQSPPSKNPKLGLTKILFKILKKGELDDANQIFLQQFTIYSAMCDGMR